MADETEQQLREKIASQKCSLANLPTLSSIVDETGFSSSETKARAQLIKELSDTEEQLELLLESKRVAAVVRLQDELHPPLNSEDCPICLETIKHINSTTVNLFFCCGGLICKQCSDESKTKCRKEGFDEMFRDKCPLCREKMPRADDYKEVVNRILKHANKGRAWAQAQIGTYYLKEKVGRKFGFALNEEKGLQLMKEAADQRFPDALFQMALACTGGQTLERDESKYMYYLKEAADLGHPCAQHMLGLAYDNCRKGKKHLHYITLAASQGEAEACGVLGVCFMRAACGLTKSLILAKHYSEKSLEDVQENGIFELSSAFVLSLSLVYLGLERYEGIIEIPGYSPIPKSLFWARKALEDDSLPIRDNAIQLISELENDAKNHCANCRKEAENSSFKRCVRCLGAWYCGKECQVQHWKNGHKFDCIKSK